MYIPRFSDHDGAVALMAAAVVLASSPAAAHWGHLADLGGHAHWAGLALGAAVAALAAGLAAADRARGEDEEAPLNSEDPEGDPADA